MEDPHKVFNFLKLKLVEKERIIFELQKELSDKDEKVHAMERLVRASAQASLSEKRDQIRFRSWRSTSQTVVASLLERLSLVESAYAGLLELKGSFQLEMPVSTRQSSIYPLAQSETERLLASTLVECARYRHDANEQRARCESLSQQLALLLQTHRPQQLSSIDEGTRTQLRLAEATIAQMQSFHRQLVREKETLALELESLRHRSRPVVAHDVECASPAPPPFRLPSNKYNGGMHAW